MQEFGNQKLKRKLSELAQALEDDYEITFELVTTSTLTAGAQADLATFQQQLADIAEREDVITTITVIDSDKWSDLRDFSASDVLQRA